MIQQPTAPQESDVRAELFRRLRGVPSLGTLTATPVRFGGSPPFTFIGPISEIADGALPGTIGLFDRDYIVTVISVIGPYAEAAGSQTTSQADLIAADLRRALEGIENQIVVVMDSTDEPEADDIREIIANQSGTLPPSLAMHLRVRGLAS